MLSQGGPLNLGMRFRVCVVVFFFPAKLLTDICHFSPVFSEQYMFLVNLLLEVSLQNLVRIRVGLRRFEKWRC